MQEPILSVGIVSAKEIPFTLKGQFHLNSTSNYFEGIQSISISNDKLKFQEKEYTELIFEPTSPNNYFILNEVVIGVDFHWERKEPQSFRGSLKLIINNDKIVAINLIEIEEYLKSVISSEMSATASLELLKSHAVISRSWLISQIEKKNSISIDQTNYQSDLRTESEWIKWWDREDHLLFDVCADDHCQRYQGITRETTHHVNEAIEATRGELLVYRGKICDARFSKCCGGVLEKFENCWEPAPHPYLQKVFDRAECSTSQTPDLCNEKEAQEWILSNPEAFCNTNNKKVLAQILNNYDQETTDFYRWSVSYSQQEISELIQKRVGIDFGQITDLQPIERGESGRITRLKIIGTKCSLVIGKELFIRKALSETHLYSSAFVVQKSVNKSNSTLHFTLCGAGWGHGVGLCQIGAALMGEKGYSYDEILKHYYREVELIRKY